MKGEGEIHPTGDGQDAQLIEWHEREEETKGGAEFLAGVADDPEEVDLLGAQDEHFDEEQDGVQDHLWGEGWEGGRVGEGVWGEGQGVWGEVRGGDN